MPSAARSSDRKRQTAPGMKLGLRFPGGGSISAAREGRARTTRGANHRAEEPEQSVATVGRVSLSATADRALFHVVFVCTGNRARSALAEGFLRAKSRGEAIRIESYGTLELGPVPPLPEAIAAAAALGIDIRDHRARSLEGIRLDHADLVVGFEPVHVAAAVVDAGAARERAFMFRELAALLEDIEPAARGETRDARALVALADARRFADQWSSLSLDDPYGKSRRVYKETATTIASLTSTLATRLFGPSPDRRPSDDTRGLDVV